MAKENKTDKEELNSYFKADKSTWYIINNAGEKIWKQEKVDEFWRRIREYKMKVKDYNFEDFVFPKFQQDGYTAKERYCSFDYDFWYARQVMDFEGEATFVRAKFMDVSLLRGIKFKKVKFILTVFENRADFTNCIFSELSDFGSANFKKTATFTQSTFDKVRFNNTKFHESFYSYKVNFNAHFRFFRLKVSEKATFDYAEFKKPVEFSNISEVRDFSFINTKFEDKATFLDCSFNRLNIESVTTSKSEQASPPKIIFLRSSFNKFCKISRTNLKYLAFDNCDVSEVNFSRCEWHVRDGRLILNESNKSPYDLEEHYRGLKKNFDSKKDWELSGLAYVSEMDLRRKILKKEKRWLEYIVFTIYKELSGYTQNYQTSLKGIIYLFLICIIIYGIKLVDLNLNEIIQASLSDILIIFKKPDTIISKIEKSKFSNFFWYFSNTIGLLSTLLTTFTILALRKRFKQ